MANIRSGNLRNRSILVVILIIVVHSTIGYQKQTSNRVKTREYIPFEHVLKKNFLLQEKITTAETDLLDALQQIETYKVICMELQQSERQTLSELQSVAGWFEDYVKRNEERAHTFQEMVQDLEVKTSRHQDIRQRNIQLEIELKEAHQEIAKLQCRLTGEDDVVEKESPSKVQFVEFEVRSGKCLNFGDEESLTCVDSVLVNNNEAAIEVKDLENMKSDITVSNQENSKFHCIWTGEEDAVEAPCEKVPYIHSEVSSRCSNSGDEESFTCVERVLEKENEAAPEVKDLENIKRDIIVSNRRVTLEYCEDLDSDNDLYNDSYVFKEDKNSRDMASEIEVLSVDSSTDNGTVISTRNRTLVSDCSRHGMKMAPSTIMLDFLFPEVSQDEREQYSDYYFKKQYFERKLTTFISRRHRLRGKENMNERSQEFENLLNKLDRIIKERTFVK